MKRAVFIVLMALFISALIICITVLSSCDVKKETNGKETETIKIDDADSTDTNPTCDPHSEKYFCEPIKVKYTATDIHVYYSNDYSDLSEKIYLIKSTDELTAYWDSTQADDTVIFEPHDFGEEFFKDNYLVIVSKFAYSGSIQRKAYAVDMDINGILTVYIEEYCPVVFTDDCSGWTHFIEVDRRYEVDSTDDIKVYCHTVESFSYNDDIFFLQEDRTLVRDGFINIEMLHIANENEAIRRAYNEINTKPYIYHAAAYDIHNDMWRVTFYNGKNHDKYHYLGCDGCVTVYLSAEGITAAMIYHATDQAE